MALNFKLRGEPTFKIIVFTSTTTLDLFIVKYQVVILQSKYLVFRRDTPWYVRWWDTREGAETKRGILSVQSGRSQNTILCDFWN